MPPSDVHAVAEKFDATVFDMPNGDWSHDANKCTFDTMLARFGLRASLLASRRSKRGARNCPECFA
ncbi:MAG: chromate resistance protein ChrB domain-containing protein [Pseudomonadota bacterium]